MMQENGQDGETGPQPLGEEGVSSTTDDISVENPQGEESRGRGETGPQPSGEGVSSTTADISVENPQGDEGRGRGETGPQPSGEGVSSTTDDISVENPQGEEGRGRGETESQSSDDKAAGPSADPPTEGVEAEKEEGVSLEEGGIVLEEVLAMLHNLEDIEDFNAYSKERLKEVSLADDSDIDALFPMLASELEADQVSQMPSESNKLDAGESAETSPSLMGSDEPAGEERGCEEEKAAGGASPSKSENKLHQEEDKNFKKAPVFHFMLETFAVDPPVERPQKKREREENEDGGAVGPSGGSHDEGVPPKRGNLSLE